jgi:DNA polymerase-3 subunit delta
MDRLMEVEAACKRSGAPAELLASRALLEIAANAPGRRRGST